MQERVRNRIIVIEALDRHEHTSDEVAAALGIDKEALATFCRRHGLQETYHRLWRRAEEVRDYRAEQGAIPSDEAYDAEFPDEIENLVRVKRGAIWVFVPRDSILTAEPREEYL